MLNLQQEINKHKCFQQRKRLRKNGIKAEISAITGNQCLQDGDMVKRRAREFAIKLE